MGKIEKPEQKETLIKPQPKTGGLYERLGLMKDIASNQREGFKEYMEGDIAVYQKNFQLGEPKVSPEKEEISPDPSKLTHEKAIIEASVSSTEFDMVWHKESWYKPYILAATQITNCYELLDEPTKKWFKRAKPGIDLLIKLGQLPEEEYKKKYKKEIWAFVKEKGSSKFYGSNGVLNFLLAFNRAKEIYPDLEKSSDSGFKIDDIKVVGIKLKLGKGKGKRKGEKDRYAKIYLKRSQEPKIEKISKKESLNNEQISYLNYFLEELEVSLKPDSKISLKEIEGKFKEFAKNNQIPNKDQDKILSFFREKTIKPYLGDIEISAIKLHTKETWGNLQNWERIVYKMNWSKNLKASLSKAFPEEEKKISFSTRTANQISSFLKKDPKRIAELIKHLK